LRAVQLLLGHKKLDTTALYTRVAISAIGDRRSGRGRGRCGRRCRPPPGPRAAAARRKRVVDAPPKSGQSLLAQSHADEISGPSGLSRALATPTTPNGRMKRRLVIAKKCKAGEAPASFFLS
jgi:hypothetical protein